MANLSTQEPALPVPVEPPFLMNTLIPNLVRIHGAKTLKGAKECATTLLEAIEAPILKVLTDRDWERAEEALNYMESGDDSLGPTSAGRMVDGYDGMSETERVRMYFCLDYLISRGHRPA